MNTYPKCPYAAACGSCQYQGMPYEEQLRHKQQRVQELLQRFAAVQPILGMKDPYHYRNKVHHVFARQQGRTVSGTYQAGTHRVIALEHCLIEDEKSQEIIADIRSLMRSFKYTVYNEDTGSGLIRHVLVRRGFSSGEVMVILVTGQSVLPSKNNFVKALRKLHPEITTLVQNINSKKTSMVLGERENILYGPGMIRDTLCGCTFRISPKSFYQVNPVQTEVLYQTAMEYAKLTGRETVIDAYCGIGTIGLIAARRAKKVIGVELNPDAVRDAKRNAQENGLNHAEFCQGDAGEFMLKMAEEGRSADVVLMDPPRSGSSTVFLQSLMKLGPKRVVYVSCDPETLARDLEILTEQKYAVERIQPVDMFPFTSHVETVVALKARQ